MEKSNMKVRLYFSRACPRAARVLVCASLAALAVHATIRTTQVVAQVPDAAALEGLVWRHVGPPGNRVSAVAGVPGDPNVYYVGAASGGVFKSEDGGHFWAPIFDDQRVASIGALAVAPSNPQIVWAGTGEAHIRSNVSHGNGVYRSLDGGSTWEHVGLQRSGRVARIVIHPTDPNTVYVAATGHMYGPQEERGVFRTHDGGRTWQRVLHVDPQTGASDLVMMPDDPRVLFAGMWTMLIRPWGRWSGGPNGGLYTSRDGGDTWQRLEGKGLPEGMTGKIGMAVTPADPRRIYALIETSVNREFEPFEDHEGVLWRSDDRGASWRMINAEHELADRPHYYSRVVAAPHQADQVHLLATRHWRSNDGGVSVRPTSCCVDNHDLWIDPLQPTRMILGSDRGVAISATGGLSWPHRPLLPIAQMYHVTTDTRVPYNLYGSRQDGRSVRGPSRTLYSNGDFPVGEWRGVGGCESGWVVPDTVSNDVVWGGCFEGGLDRHVISRGHSRPVNVWPDRQSGMEARALRYRFQWTFPIHISPWDPERVYVGSQHVHQTTDGGQSWQVISPDLTSNADSLQRRAGGLTTDDTDPTVAPALFAIAESPRERGVIWAGSNDGLIHITRNGGRTWSNVTPPMPELPPLGAVSSIEPSRFGHGRAYVVIDRHQMGDFEPYVYVAEDYGARWRRIDAQLPRSMISWAHVVREDPVRAGLLYLGTEDGVYASIDHGSSWISLQTNLPHAPVHWLTIQPHFNDLVAATYGRGFWIMDDITPLQQITPAITEAALHLFAPRPAYRFVPVDGPMVLPYTASNGENPLTGASLYFWIAPETADSAHVEIHQNGERVARLPGLPAKAGLNRVYWNLRFEPARAPRLRMPPLEHSHERVGPDGSRPYPEGGRVLIEAPPGEYDVRLTVGNTTLSTTLRVLQDPASQATLADIEAQTEMLKALRDDANRAGDLVEEIEWLRWQTARRLEQAATRGVVQVHAPARALETALIDLEMNIFDLRQTGPEDGLGRPRRLYTRIAGLAVRVSGSDHHPTDQAREVHALLRSDLESYLRRMDQITGTELATLNSALTAAGLERIVVRLTSGRTDDRQP